ncbi:protein tweety homolog 1 isoform X1 [Microcaecilia unicolor]|uniref:Protein tweety homolog n=1 Tax=Microcaecilia unicolor TaxID=1415580 RepID=A0A6P7XKU4_9AMPH|nr:protein tweety homolog 1 isoform X1 [Microcaecilia unicolor]
MSGSQGYRASWWTFLLHQVPHTNFQFEVVDNTFAPQDWEYQQALLFLAAFAGLCLAISLVLVCVYLIRLFCCGLEEEDTKGHRLCCVTWSCVVAVIVCCAAIGVGFYGNSETNDGTYQVAHSLMNANHTLTAIDLLVSDTVELLGTVVRTDLTRLEDVFSRRTEFLVTVRNTRRQMEAVAHHLSHIPFWRSASLSPAELAEQITFMEDYRWLAYVLLLLLDLIITLFTLLGLAKQMKWLVIVMTVMSFFVLILSWGSMGLETAAVVGLSDFCSSPDTYVLNTTHLRTGVRPEVLQYYLECNQDVASPFQQRLTMSQRALSNIHSQLHGLEQEAVPQFPAAEKNLMVVQGVLNSTEGSFHHLVALLNCRGLHKDYVDALKGLCYDGMEGLLFLLLFSFLSALAFTTSICSLPRACKRFQNRDLDYDDMDEDDPFNPQARRQAQRVVGRPHLPSSHSYRSSCGSRNSLQGMALPISNAPVSQYMNQSASFSGSPRYENVTLAERHSPPPSYSPSMRTSYICATHCPPESVS